MLPTIASTVRGLAAGATPNGDRAIIAIRSYDVLTTHPPLVGQFSAASVVAGHETHSLGPLLYWLLAVPARIGPPALVVAMGAVNSAAAIGSALLARRRGGTALMIGVAIALALMSRSLPAETWHDIYNPSVGVLPLTLLLFLCWSVACGEHRLLPAAVGVASFVAQAELAFVLPALGALAVAVAGLGRSRGWRRSGLAALAVALICWSGPLVDQAVHRPGNIALVVKAGAASTPRLGVDAGWRAVVRAVGVPPRWLRIPQKPFDRLADATTAPSALAAISCALVLGALALVTVLGVRRRSRPVATAGAIGLVLSGALAAVAARTPTKPVLELSLNYTLWWGSPAGMWIWLVLGFSAAVLGRPRWPTAPARLRALAPAVAAAAAVGVGTAVALAQKDDQDRPEYGPIRTLDARVAKALPRPARTVRVAGPGAAVDFDFRAALMYDLRRRGIRPVAFGGATARLGTLYRARHGRRYPTVYVSVGPPPGRHGHVIARVPFRSSGATAVIASFQDASGGRRRRAPGRFAVPDLGE